MDNFEVSVVIPAYNVEKYIGPTIESVLNQSFAAKEIIVVNDGSSDNTAQAIKKYPQVKYIDQTNAGVSVARNTGIDAAKCKWIAFLDGDDLWLENKLADQKKVIDDNPELKWVAGNYIVHDFRKDKENPLTAIETAKSWVKNNSYINYFEHFKDFGITSNVTLTKEAIVEAGCFKPGLTRTEDTDLWIRVAYKNKYIGYCPEPIMYYNFHREGSTNHQRKFNCRSGFTDTLNMYREQVARAKSCGMVKELDMILNSSLKGMIRTACRGRQFDLARDIDRDFTDHIRPGIKLYLKWHILLNSLNILKQDQI